MCRVGAGWAAAGGAVGTELARAGAAQRRARGHSRLQHGAGSSQRQQGGAARLLALTCSSGRLAPAFLCDVLGPEALAGVLAGGVVCLDWRAWCAVGTRPAAPATRMLQPPAGDPYLLPAAQLGTGHLSVVAHNQSAPSAGPFHSQEPARAAAAAGGGI